MGGFLVVGSGFQVGFEAVVGRRIVIGRPGSAGKAVQRRHHSVLGGREQQAVEIGEVQLLDVGIEIVANVETPAIAPGRAFAIVFGERLERLAKVLQLLQRVERSRFARGRSRRRGDTR